MSSNIAFYEIKYKYCRISFWGKYVFQKNNIWMNVRPYFWKVIENLRADIQRTDKINAEALFSAPNLYNSSNCNS